MNQHKPSTRHPLHLPLRLPARLAFLLPVIVGNLLCGCSVEAQEELTIKHRSPEPGAVFKYAIETTMKTSMGGEAEGQELTEIPMKSAFALSAAYTVTVLEVDGDGISKAEFLIEDCEIETSESVLPPGVSSGIDPASKGQSPRNAATGQTYLFSRGEEGPDVRGLDGSPPTEDELQNVQQVTATRNSFFFNHPDKHRTSLYDPGQGLSLVIPLNQAIERDQVFQIPKETAARLVRLKPGWDSTNLSTTTIQLVDQHSIGGDPCAIFELVVRGKGPCREPLGGLEGEATVSIEATITLEIDSGWARQIEMIEESASLVEGNFQGVAMKMRSNERMQTRVEISTASLPAIGRPQENHPKSGESRLNPRPSQGDTQ